MHNWLLMGWGNREPSLWSRKDYFSVPLVGSSQGNQESIKFWPVLWLDPIYCLTTYRHCMNVWNFMELVFLAKTCPSFVCINTLPRAYINGWYSLEGTGFLLRLTNDYSFPAKWLNTALINQFINGNFTSGDNIPCSIFGWVQTWPTLSAYVYDSENPRVERNCKIIWPCL